MAATPSLMAVDSRGEAIEVALVQTRDEYEKEVRRLERRLDALDPQSAPDRNAPSRRKSHA